MNNPYALPRAGTCYDERVIVHAFAHGHEYIGGSESVPGYNTKKVETAVAVIERENGRMETVSASSVTLDPVELEAVT